MEERTIMGWVLLDPFSKGNFDDRLVFWLFITVSLHSSWSRSVVEPLAEQVLHPALQDLEHDMCVTYQLQIRLHPVC
jgi:hypothetical protein